MKQFYYTILTLIRRRGSNIIKVGAISFYYFILSSCF